MMKILFTAVMFALCGACALGEETDKLVLHCYPVASSVMASVLGEPESGASKSPFSGMDANGERRTNRSVREFFSRAGISFPPGSDISYNEVLSDLCMRNKVSEHERLKVILQKLEIIPTSVQLDASFVAISLKDIEAAARKNPSAAPTRAQILELCKSGKRQLMETHKVLTRSGVNANSRSVEEHIYPEPHVIAESVGTNPAAVVSVPDVRGVFETREVGMIFNITPTVQPDGTTIDLVIAPEWSGGGVWDDITTKTDGEKQAIRLPRFHAGKLASTLVVESGATAIQGGMASRDGQSRIYLFLTARIVDRTCLPRQSTNHFSEGWTNEMIPRVYSLASSVFDSVVKGATAKESSREDAREFFMQAGVPFPPGSSLRYDRTNSTLHVVNTAENLFTLDAIMATGFGQTMVELDASFVAFDISVIDAEARKNPGSAPTTEQIANLWKAGKGRLLGTHKLVTCTGVNAQTSAVDEQIYPAGFTAADVPSTNTTGASTSAAAVHTAFETREIGTIFDSTPHVMPDGSTIELVLASEFSEAGVWDEVTAPLNRSAMDGGTLSVRVPRFHTTKLTSTLQLFDGITAVQGGMASRDGGKLIYILVTPRLVGPDGAPVQPDAKP